MVSTLDRPRPRLALVVGSGATILIAAVTAPMHDHVTRALPLLLLVVPVVATALVAGRTESFVVAGCATLAFSLAVPPLGSFRIQLRDDLLALAVFGAVAFVVSWLVTTRVSALEYVDEQRRALLRAVSHDLRTPLAAIHAVATDLRSGTPYDEATRDEVLDLLIDETEHLDRVVANLLSMSRIEAGTMRPQFAAVDTAALIEACAYRLARLFRDWTLHIDVPADLPLVEADPAQITQVLNNLLENAVKHTPPGTHVSISARAVNDGNAVRIVVADDGPGLGALTDGAHRGSGLTICSAIVQLHRGTIVSEPREKGASVAFTLPRAV